jgi:exosortase
MIMTGGNLPKTKFVIFMGLTLLAAVMIYIPLKNLLTGSPHSPYYAHIPFIPLVSAAYLIMHRKDLHGGGVKGTAAGAALAATGAGLYLAASALIGGDGGAAFRVIMALAFWSGTFLAVFGVRAFKSSFFAIAFLLLMVPLPWRWMEGIFSVLVRATADVMQVLLIAFRIPFVRHGAVFALPAVDFEVWPACSGFRPALALLVTGVVAGRLFLRGILRRVALVSFVPLIAVLDSGIRVFLIYVLAFQIDMDVLNPGHWLHRVTGYVFFVLGLTVLGLILKGLTRGEDAGTSPRQLEQNARPSGPS